MNYFKQEKFTLLNNRKYLEDWLLNMWHLKTETVVAILEAYDYFCENPDDYDGSTIINDFYIIPGLDIWAVVHDYIFVKFNVAVNIYYKFLADLLYAKLLRKFKHSWIPVWIFRFGGLTITSIFLLLYKKFKYNLKMTEDMKIDFINYFKKFE